MKGGVFFDSQNILWKWMTTCSSFSQLQRDREVLKSEAGRRRGQNGSLLAEVASVGPETPWQPDRPVVWSCTYGSSVSCVCLCAVELVGLWGWYQCCSQLISGFFAGRCHFDLPRSHFWIWIPTIRNAGLAFHSLLRGWMCPVWSDQSFHGWLTSKVDLKFWINVGD